MLSKKVIQEIIRYKMNKKNDQDTGRLFNEKKRQEQEINIWQKLPKYFTVLAPMEGVTDVVFRQVINRASSLDRKSVV